MPGLIKFHDIDAQGRVVDARMELEKRGFELLTIAACDGLIWERLEAYGRNGDVVYLAYNGHGGFTLLVDITDDLQIHAVWEALDKRYPQAAR